MTDVLLLDAAFFPLRVISWKKAMVLWFQEKAHVLEEQQHEIRGETWCYKIPSVIQLKNYVRHRLDTVIRFCRKNVFIRDEFCCQYCNKKIIPQWLTIDHIIPKSRGGPTNWINVVTACKKCNQKKKGHTLEESHMKLKKVPTKPENADFFKYSLASVPSEWDPYLILANKKGP